MIDHPFIVDQWDILIIALAGFVRMLFALKYKAKQLSAKKQPFDLKYYFDFRHVFRWTGHFVTAFTLALVVPEFTIDYLAPKFFPELTSWSFIGDFVIGFLGYDLVRFTEEKTRPLIEKVFK